MADEATLLVKIKTILDKSTVMRDIKVIGDKVQDAVGLNSPAASSGSGGKPSGGNLLSTLGGGLKKGLGFMGKMLSVMGKIFSGLSIVASIIEVFKPAFSLIDSMFKMIAEFLRPISDIFVILLAPLLTMLKPIVQMFRVLMQPFKQLAMKGLSAANVLISQGMRTGGETGAAMVGAGFKGAVSSASLLFSGFIQATLGQLLGSIEAFGIGEGFKKVLDGWESLAIGGIMKVTAKADLIKDIGNSIDEVNSEALVQNFKTINVFVNELRKQVDGFSVSTFKENMTVVQENMDTVFDPFIELTKGDGDLIKYIDDTTSAMNGLGKKFPETAGVIANSIIGVMSDWQEAINQMDVGGASGVMQAGMPALIKKLEGIEKTSFGQKSWDVTKDLGFNMLNVATLGLLPGKMRKFGDRRETWVNDVDAERTEIVDEYMKMFPQVKEGQKKGLTEMLTDMNLYMGHSLIPDSMMSGLQHMNQMVQNYMGPKGYSTIAAIDGFKLMEDSAKSFNTTMKDAAKDMSQIANIAANSIRQALRAAKSAQRSYSRSY